MSRIGNSPHKSGIASSLRALRDIPKDFINGSSGNGKGSNVQFLGNDSIEISGLARELSEVAEKMQRADHSRKQVLRRVKKEVQGRVQVEDLVIQEGASGIFSANNQSVYFRHNCPAPKGETHTSLTFPGRSVSVYSSFPLTPDVIHLAAELIQERLLVVPQFQELYVVPSIGEPSKTGRGKVATIGGMADPENGRIFMTYGSLADQRLARGILVEEAPQAFADYWSDKSAEAGDNGHYNK